MSDDSRLDEDDYHIGLLSIAVVAVACHRCSKRWRQWRNRHS